jgi:hypothetical protein
MVYKLYQARNCWRQEYRRVAFQSNHQVAPVLSFPTEHRKKTEKVIVKVFVSVNCQSCRSTTVKKDRRKNSMESAAKHKPAAHRMRRWNFLIPSVSIDKKWIS